jgi:hypothetical protein
LKTSGFNKRMSSKGKSSKKPRGNEEFRVHIDFNQI